MVAPLDRVKILFQASNPEYRHYAGMFYTHTLPSHDEPYLCDQDHGMAHFEPSRKSIGMEDLLAYSRVIPPPYCVYFRTRPSSLWPMTRSKMYAHPSSLLLVVLSYEIQILMPTRDQQTNLRRFTAGALSGQSPLPQPLTICILTSFFFDLHRHHLCILHLPS